MSPSRLVTCGVFWLLLAVYSPDPARAEVSLAVSGISSVSGSNIAQAEKAAFEDAFFKAYLSIALKTVPASSSADVAQRLLAFVASRGTQDIIQYQITSRSQQGNILLVNLDLKINEAPLKDWLQTQALTTPLGLRPRVLMAVTTRGPGASERHEWWTSAMPRGYSPFESQLSARLKDAGENVIDPPSGKSAPPAGADRARALGLSAGADLVVSGLLSHRSADAVTVDSRLDISLTEVKTGEKLFSTTVSLRGSVDARAMNELMITVVFDQMRAEIARKVVVVIPEVVGKTLCIEGITSHDTYQSLLNALRSIDGVSRVTVSSVRGHTICHDIQFRGSLQDILDALKQKGVVPADMVIQGDAATIRLLNP